MVLNTTPTLDTQLTSKLYVDTALNGKQDKLSAGNNITIDGNTISSTGGGEINQEQLDSIAKLASANTFTANQTVVGDLKGDYVLVKNTTPTLTTHVTSKLYVDTAVNKKQNTFTFMDSLVLSSIVV